MNKKQIKKLIQEAFTDNVYGKYPYSHRAGEEDQPTPDFEAEWSAFSDRLLKNPKIDEVIEFAKILVKDKDMLADVLEAIGTNKSIGTAFMRQMDFTDKFDDLLKDKEEIA